MTEVVSVKFRNGGKSYYFDPSLLTIKTGARVIVDTANGMEIATCSMGVHYVPDEKVVQPLRKVVRLATEDDLRVEELCRKREIEARGIAREKIAAHGLDMKLVNVECAFDGGKITFFFTSDGRVDFRELVRDLASVFRTRIELRQIGVRDETKQLGGIGICGRPYCCRQFLDDFAPVSTKMAKTQSLSLNPAKISGSCGRLMCCLRYEQEAYQDLVKSVPKNGAFVETPDGYGNVTQVNLLRRKVKVKLDSDTDNTLHQYEADDVASVPGGRPKPGDEIPHVLVPREKQPEEEPEEEEAPYSTVASSVSRGYSPASPLPAVTEEDSRSREDGSETPAEREGSSESAAKNERSRSRNRNRNRSRSRSRQQNGAESTRQQGGSGAAETENASSGSGEPPKIGRHGGDRKRGKNVPEIRLGPGSVKETAKQEAEAPAEAASEAKREISPAQKNYGGHGRNSYRHHSRSGQKPSGDKPNGSAGGNGQAAQPKQGEAPSGSGEKSSRPRSSYHRRYRGHGGHGGNKGGSGSDSAPKSE